MGNDCIKIANCSGYYGDKLSAAKDMVDGGPIDVLTGDYLAELTMAILFNQKLQRGEDKGYVGTFLKQIKEIVASCKEKNIKIVSFPIVFPCGWTNHYSSISDSWTYNYISSII